MFKTHEKSRFEAMNSDTIRNTERIIIQIGEKKLHSNPSGLAVFLCETVAKEDYERETVEGQLEAALEELNNQKAKATAMEELLEQSKDKAKQVADRLYRSNAENKKLFEALQECERIFGELPKEIKELLEGGLDNVYNGAV